ncbi:50S ribosome-binding GTPase [Desulfurispirillum indicum]|uniref:dynamin family protein n=1 Tax=Desulfurispirillum indicum TaxID=936456 RepID=UPI001CF99193|nr:dynamin family protein [Desulfurispirillum indicum]UCZ57124.1 50S ribosome-binding GTPase [Desulfurispirillum indicum]
MDTTTKPVRREDLIACFQEIADTFVKNKHTIKSKEDAFFSAISKLEKELLQAAKDLDCKVCIADGNPLAHVIVEYSKLLSHQFAEWRTQAEQYDRGTDFRKNHDDSLLVYVFGKVKSGKSSLGNYIAWGLHDPDPQQKKNIYDQPIPQFHVHTQSNVTGGDEKEEAKLKQQFKVNELEATSSIQTFTIPGLTWVDSPGIHSMHDERNGKLAREYVESADLVVYATHSHSPGRASEMAEVKLLLEKSKPLVVLITGSDVIEEDEDADGNIISELTMKPLTDQQAQIQYVEEQLREVDPNKLVLSKVIPVSVKYAEENSKNEARYCESGIPQFFSILMDISRGQGVELKLKTPLSNLNNFLKKIQLSQKEIAFRRENLRTALEEIRQNLADQEKAAIIRTQRHIAAEIPIAIEKHRGDSQKISQQLNAKLRTAIEQEVTNVLQELFAKFDAALLSAADFSAVPELPGFQERHKEFKVSDAGKKGAVGTAAGGIAAAAGGFALFNLWNPVGLALAAFAVGSAVIGSGAAWVGGKIGEEFGEEKAMRAIIGDNIDEIENTAHEVYHSAVELLVPKMLTESTTPLFNTFDSFLDKSTQAFSEFENTISSEVSL